MFREQYAVVNCYSRTGLIFGQVHPCHWTAHRFVFVTLVHHDVTVSNIE